ncbi:RodZ family helix-turn-helix domain-containing protein [Streptococcus merionis]|uniref:helix-turn-helix domain-containing protein n=1 Tax=Streptococcus merionis TaxID=400065 RepID=UPI0026EF9B81|nr:helix-turn-helix domain-containing protein [Streptococcus merionis]
MAELTIGQVLKAAREDLQISISDANRHLKTHRRYIRALEKDQFETISGNNQARKLLVRYAEFLELDVEMIMDAFDTHSRLRVYEVGPDKPRYVRSKLGRSGQSHWGDALLILLSLALLSFIGYTVWSYQQSEEQTGIVDNEPTLTETTVSEVVESKTDEASQFPTETSETQDAQLLDITLTPSVNPTAITVNQAPDKIELTLSVKDSESWVAVSNTELASGITLSAEEQTATVLIDKMLTPSVILSIGVVKGLKLTINGQNIDLSSVNVQPTALTLYFN